MGRSFCPFLTKGYAVLLSSILCSVIVGASAASAYPTPVDFDGSLMRWPLTPDSPPVTYEIKADHEADVSTYGVVVEDAALLWSNVPTSYFSFAPRVGEDDAQVTVHLQSTINGSTYSSGYAVFDKYQGAAPSHCSIYISTAPDQSYRAISKTILHELGHCAGLGHTLIPEAIMSYELSKNAYALDIDDEAALTRLYPADGSSPQLPPGCAVLPDTPQGFSNKLMLLIFLAPLLCPRKILL